VPVAPWVSRADLPAGTPGGEAEQDAACDLATTVLFGLSGRRWAGRAERTIEVRATGTPWWWRDASLGLAWDQITAGPGGTPALPYLAGGEVWNTPGGEVRVLRLPDYPVRAVTAVTVGGIPVDPDGYWLTGSRFLERHRGYGWDLCAGGRHLTVSYEYGAEPPAAGRAAAARLAVELAKAAAGVQSALPGYLTQRVRQGETLTYVGADTLFDKGRTGLTDVDLWLTTVNPAGLRRRSRSWSPDTDPRYRTTETGGPPPP
jgi:hypothetical protein